MFALLNHTLDNARQHHLVDALLARQRTQTRHRRARSESPPQRRKILFESLEPRLLLSADLLPGAVQSSQAPQPPVDIQVVASTSTPQIHWSAPIVTGDAALYASSVVSGFDLDNFNSPLVPVAPAGGLVYAGGVQGTLDFEGDSDALTLNLDGGQTFTLRFKPNAGLQASIEALGPNGLSLGSLQAANIGDSLVLQLSAATDTGSYSINVNSLTGAGSYTVEIFLNAALEGTDTSNFGNAQNFDGAFSFLLDSSALRAAVVGDMSAQLPTRVVAQEDFEDGLVFDNHVTDGTWLLESDNPGAHVAREVAGGEVPASYLTMHADQSAAYSQVEVDNGEGGTYLQDQYTYEPALDQATWRVNLAGVTQATLSFARWGNDPNGQSAGEDFIQSANFDGVSISVDGNYWVVLQNFGGQYGGVSDSSIDLVQAAAQHGLTLGSDTRIRFQFYDQGGTDTQTHDYYRNIDNIRITTNQQQLLLTPAGVSSSGTEGVEYFNSIDRLTDGFVPTEGTEWLASSNVYWVGQEVFQIGSTSGELAPSAGVLSGLSFSLDLGSEQRVSDLVLSVDNNDDYVVDYSVDGANWNRLLNIYAVNGDVFGGMDTFSSMAGNQDYDSSIDFTAVQARYLRFYATGGDSSYAVGDIQAFADAVVDQEDWYSLTLNEGEIANFTLSQDGSSTTGTLALALFDPSQNLVTDGLAAGGQVNSAIENFRAPTTGTYYVRVSGTISGEYNLVAVKQAQFGATNPGTHDLTLTPVILDALSGAPNPVRVAVVNGGNIINQLNDDTYFNFSASSVNYTQIDTLQELSNFDVVVLGNYVNPSDLGAAAPALRQWVEAGHGLVTTGWMAYYASLQYGNVNTDLDAVIPINLNTYTGYTYGNPLITINGPSHPVTQGVTDFTSPYYNDYVVYGVNGIDAGATSLGSVAGGQPAIIVATPGDGRSVVLAPTYEDSNGWSSGAADRLLEQAVAWSAAPVNTYTVQALAGTDVVVTLDLLGADIGQPANDLAPVLELLDAAGTVLASGSTSVSVSVPENATFTVKVRGAGTGDYLLRVSGDLPDVVTPLRVVSSSLDGVDALINFPGQVDLTFSAPVLYTSLEGFDLTVNGMGADSYEVLSPTRVRFHFASAFGGDRAYLLLLGSGGVTDIHGNANQEWAHGFTVDSHGPQVIATSVTQGATLAPGVQTLTFTLNERLDTSNLGVSDVQLFETLTNQIVAITAFSFDNDTHTLTLTTATLGEGAYTLTLLAGYYGFKDALGNPLDGNADGTNGDDFTLQFGVDVGTTAYPPMQALPPLGSLVFDPIIAGVIQATGDVDSYTVNLNSGQLLTAIANVVSDTLQLEISIIDADDDSVVAVLLGNPGEGVVLQAMSGLSGNYRVDITGVAGTGSYTFSLLLNALAEDEMLLGGDANNTIAMAMDLQPASLALGAGGASRLAVVGQRATGNQLDDDNYRVHLLAGQATSVALAWVDGNTGDLQLELLAGDGTLQVLSATDAANAQRAIRDFVAPLEGDYILRVSGAASGRYNLVVTRGLSFSLPSAIPNTPAQDISLTGQVLGNTSASSSAERAAYLYSANVSEPWNNTTNDTAMNTAFGSGQWDTLRFETVNVTAMLASHATLFLEGSDGNADELEAFLTAHLTELEAWVARGNTLFINAAPNEGNGMSLGFGGVTLRYSDSSNTGTIVNTSHPIFQGPNTPVIATYTGGSFTHASVSGGGITPLIRDNTGDAVLAELAWGNGRVLFGGMTTTNFHGPQPAATNLRANILAYAASQVQSANAYRIQVSSGQALTLTMTMPGQGPGEPGNDLVPELELIDPNGNTVTFDVGSGNGTWTHTSLLTGAYVVRVGAAAGSGDFVLHVDGIDPSQAPLLVASASIAPDARMLTPPNQVDLVFSEPLSLPSIQASDLTLNGQTPLNVTVMNANTLRFDITGLVTADGSYTLAVAAGALSDAQNTGNLAFSRTFFLDTTLPSVSSSSVSEGQVIASGASTLVFTLSEDLASTGLGAEDVLLTNTTTGQGYTASSFTYNAATDQITVQYASLSEGAYTLTLLSGANSLRDLVGNALNGNTATPQADNYTLHFNVDDPTAALPALSTLSPAGSLIYRTEVSNRAVHATGDVDAFTVTLDAGQTLTLWASQTSGATRLAIELFDAEVGGTSLGLTEAAAAGQTVLLQTLAISGGTYRIEVRSLDGAGQYTLKALLNAALETELVAGAANDSRAAAQSLSASFITTGSDRGAVVGQNTSGAEDWYSVHLEAGQIASFVLTPDSGLGTTDLWLGLYNAAGQLLTAGSDIAVNVDEAIMDFRAGSAGDYYLRVTGNSSGLYSLVVTRDQSFSLELPQGGVQDITPTGEVLGALGTGGAGGGLIAVVSDASQPGGLQAIANQLNDHNFASNNAILVSVADVDTLAELQQYSAVVIGGTGYSSNQFSAFASNLRSYVEGGGGLIVTGWGIFASGGLSGQTRIDFDAIVPVNTSNYTYFDGTTVTPVSGHPITDGVTSFQASPYIEYAASSPQVDTGATVLATVGTTPVAAAKVIGHGRSVYLGPIYSGGSGYNLANLRTGEADQFLEQAVAWAGGDNVDDYRIQVQTGDVLHISTTTPADGTGAPVNLLNARVELYDEAGVLVASDSNSAPDGRNVALDFTTLSTGAYSVRVLGELGASRGEYVLRVTGATSAVNPAPQVVASSPLDGKRVNTPPTTLTLDLSESILASSLGIDDLSIDGGATVTGVEFVDGDTVRFTLNVPNVQGTYRYSLLANGVTDLQGVGNLAHNGSFVIDTTSPRVVSQTPEVQSLSPFASWSLTFSEALNPATVQTSDFALRNPGNGTISISSATVSADGLTVTLAFNGQFAQGNYTLTAGTDIYDVAGNRMDQDSGTSGYQTYLGTVQVASPDLNPVDISISMPDGSALPGGGAALGGPVKVTWTVGNIGTDSARNGAWYDSLWLSTDTNPANDIFLANVLFSNVGGLVAGGQYANSANVTLPLNDTMNAGNFYIRVQVDSSSNQPENNENNNALYSSVFATVVPPLPDLTVTNVLAPAVIEAGKSITVSWNVNNTGGATATGSGGYWYDRIVLSTDATFGNNDDVFLSELYYYDSIAAGGQLARSATVNIPVNRTGNWNLLVKTDNYNQVYERGNEGNNVGSTSVQVVVPTEDLTPAALNAPDAALFGSKIDVSWTVNNIGTGPTYGNWYDRVFLSTDATRGADDIELTSVYAAASPDIRPVEAGGHYTRNIQNIQLPLNVSLAEGAYYLLLETDSGGNEPEISETNNVIARGIQLTLADYADLTVSNVVVPPSAHSGDTFNVSFTLNNQGEAAASNFHNYLYLSSNGTSLDYYLGDYIYSQSLAAGDSATVDRAVTIPLYSPGNWYVVVVADSVNNIYEHAHEGNNRSTSASPIVSTLPPLPDLVVSNIVMPAEALAGQAITLSWTITNQGSAAFSGTWNDRVYLANLGGALTQDFGYFSFEGTLAAGASVTRTQSLGLTPVQAGERRLVVVTDAYGQVNETPLGQDNNTLVDDTVLTITFPPLPNLQVTSLTPPNDPASGTSTAISWVVKNTGVGATSAPVWYDEIRLSLDDSWDTTEDNINLGTFVNPNYLPVGESYSNSQNITFPKGLFGEYHFMVKTDIYNQVFEDQKEGDNVYVSGLILITLTPPPDLQVDTVEAQNLAFSGQPMAISWTIGNHGAGPTAETAWYDRVVMSEDNVLGNGDDRNLGSFLHEGRLAAGATYNVSKNIPLPIGVIGEFHFFVITDNNNHVYEHGSELNNSAQDMLGDGTGPETTTVQLTPPPDLEVYSVTAPASAEAGHNYNVSWRVANFGATPTPDNYWTDRFYLSTDGILDANDISLGERGHTGVLGVATEDNNGNLVSGYYDNSASFTLPFNISGAYRLIVKTDIYNNVFEGFPANPFGENNNATASGTMNVVAKPADLAIKSFSTSATGEAGKQVSVTWTVRNDGTGDSVASSWYDQLRISADDILMDDDDIVLENFNHTGLLNPGGSYSRTETLTLPFSLTGGSYRLYVLGDVFGQVYESNNDNNSAFASIEVVRDTPDLQITSLTHEASGMVGLPLDVSWRVENQGQNLTNTNNWYDDVFLSLDAVLDNSDIYLGQRYRNASLAVDAGYNADTSFSLPTNLAPNDYFVIVRTDKYNSVTEGTPGEANNVRASASNDKVHVVPFDPNNPDGILPLELLRPDLTVTAVDAPANAISGQIMQVTWTVANNGADPTGNRNWYDAIYLSRDGVLDRNADLYLGYAYHSNLAAGASYTETLDVRVPYGQSGPFYLFVATDAGRYITEANELNNVGQDASFTQVALAPPADLVVGDIVIPANGIPGRSATITFSVNNNGTNPALGSWTDSVYLSSDDTWDINDPLFGVVTHSGDVAGGSSYSSTLTATLPGVTPGNYKVIVRSDIRNHIPESNEANNIGGSLDRVALDVEVLPLGTTGDIGNLAAGQAVYYKFDVAAGETVRLRLDSAGIDMANELYVRFGSMPSRGQFDVAARDGFVSDPDLLIPTTQAGTYYVLAYGQSVQGNPPYKITAEIIPFSVTSIFAREVGNSGDVTLRIDGARFGANTEFSLVAPDGTVTRAHAVSLDNSSEAYATFSLFGAAVGKYDVVAEQVNYLPDGTRVVLTPFTLVDALDVAQGKEAAVYMTITGPGQVMVNRTSIFTINYVNDGGTDTMAPLMILESFSATPMGLSAADLHTTPIYLMAASYDGPMDILRPGAGYSVPVVFRSSSVAGTLDMRVGRILANDTRLIADWDAIEASARPSSIPAAEWNAFWGRIQPLIGLTWGEYVQVLDRMMVMVSDPGHPIRDVRDIFARMYQQNPEFVPYASMAGEVRDSETDTGLADIQMTAYLIHENGSLEYKASALSDANGHYSFARLNPGLYKVVAIGRALDMNRDGQVDLTVPEITLGQTTPGNAGIIYIQPLGGIGASNDSNPALNRDSNGITHMVWTREGLVWHAWFDSASGTWKDARAISSADSYGPVIASSNKLFDGTGAGTVIAWQQGKGNNSEIYYAVARAKVGGGFEWSAPVRLTSDTSLDVAPQIIVGDNGLVMFTHLKRNGDIQDDTDIYYDIFPLSQRDFIWPAAATVSVADAAADTPLATEGVSVAYGRQWKFGPWDVFGTSAELVLALNGQVGENNCKATLGAQGQIQGSFKGSNIRSTIAGQGSVTAEWGVNEAAKDWMFNSAKATVGATAQFDWRYGLSTLLSKIPHPAVTAAHLAYSLAVGLGSRFGLEFEDGITFGGGINFSVLEWKAIQPFPEFVWPDGIFEVDVSGTFGLYAQLDVGPTGDSVRVQGDLTINLGIKPEFKIKSVTGNITFSGNIGWMPFNEVFSVTLYNNESADVLPSELGPQDVYIPIFDAAALVGTGATYGTNHVLSNADVALDVTSDSAMTLARDDGVIFGAWTHMADPHASQIGWNVMAAEFGTAWSTPVALDGSFGVNSYATAAVDGAGKRMVVWTHAASPLSPTPTVEDYEAAMDANNVVYATYDETNHIWSTMQTVASTAGMDSGLTVSHDASGQLVMSWVVKGAGDIDHLMTAAWNGSAWGTPQEIAFGASIMDPAMERLGNDMIVVWEVDANPDPEVAEKTLHYSIYNGIAWSSGATFDPIAMATGLALSAGLPVAAIADTNLTTESGFPPFPVPEECLKCKPEEIKRIRESAPQCLDGGGTQVTFDPKTCTEKTIVYKPCVVRPRDPNDMIGPEGYGDEAWVSSKSTLDYMIRFENAADATAPAQQVVVTQQLDSDLDWRTFRIDDFGFSEQIVELDGKSAFYQKRLDFTADPARGYFLDVSASVDVSTGIVTWTMTTIDPETGDVPQDASIGFLPVNDTVYDANHKVLVQGTGRGEGYVTYKIKALRNIETGAVVDAQARIVFDTEEPIDTPAIFNTLDAGVPTSQVIAFATGTTADSEFLVRWGGEDDANGSGVHDFSVYVSEDGGAFDIWMADTDLTEAIYLGEKGHTYSFFSTVRDWAGNEEAASGEADSGATITVSGGTGSISGTKFEDYDGDGIRDAGEAGLSGWTVFLDGNNNSVLDNGEVSTVTAVDGSYSFIDLDPGAYRVREVMLAGWVQTLPGDNSQAVNVVTDANTGNVNFGNFHLAQIGGQKFNDLNANGLLDGSEAGLADWTIQLDRDANGSIDAVTTTDQYGHYHFTDLGPGSYRVSEVMQSGWLQTGPLAGTYTVGTTSGADIGSLDFANVQASSISGIKFEDTDGDGQRDVDEHGLAGWTIFLDGNGNGSLDGGERSVVTDVNGTYRFDALLPGSYVVAEVMQAGWMQTSPGTGASTLSLAGLTLSGMDVVLSLPEDVLVEEGLTVQTLSSNSMAGTLVGLDAFRNDARFAGIDGSGVTTVVIDTGIDLNHSWFGPDLDGNGIADRIIYSHDFANNDNDASDRNGHGSHVASLIGSQDGTYGGVAQGADLIALKVFGDDGSGYFSYLENALQWVVAHADEYHIGVVNLSLGDGGNWDSAIGRYGLGDELSALAGMNILITAASGNNFFQFNSDMGVAYPAADPAVLAVGAVWSGSFGGPVNYANGAIDYGTGADQLAAFGQRDGELLDVLAPGTRMVGANYNGGSRTMFGTSQASAYMAGIATLAQDLALDHLGRRLNLSEFTTLLADTSVYVNDGDNEMDNVTNTGLNFARVNMLSLAEGILALGTSSGSGGDGGGNGNGGTHTLAAPGVHQITLAAGQNLSDVNFGNFALGSISGTVFHDLNANDLQDLQDAHLAGWTVFLDGNANGQLDIGEHSAVTDANGHYLFDDVGPGSYQVSLVAQNGWTGTTPGFVVLTMTSGLDADADFGVNARPTLDLIDGVTVNEGSSVSFTASAHDDVGDSVIYSLVGDAHGATLNAATGQFGWAALDGNTSQGFTLRVTDSAGSSTERAFTVMVNNVAPTLNLSGAASVTDDQDYVLGLSASDPGQDTISGWSVSWGDGSSSVFGAASGALAHRYTQPGNYTVNVTASDEDGDYGASTTVAVQAGTLKVTGFEATATGFQVRFNRAFAAAELNLYDSSFYNRGAADLSFKDGAGRTVAGSVVLDGDRQGLTFLKTNGLLANGTYTVNLDSRSNAFVDTAGGLLDGNRDGARGDKYTQTFTVKSSGAVMSIGEFSRGPGQAADVPATAAGVPIMITGATGAKHIEFTLAYDQSLLNITGVSGGAGIPAGSTVTASFTTPGQVRISLELTTALGAGSVELVKLVAIVPATAPYGAKQVLDLRNIVLDTGKAVRDDDGLHLVAYVGDASGNAKYSTLDVQRIQRTVVRLDSGFGAYPLVDPTVVADINGNNVLSALDAQRVLSEVMGIDRAEIPPIPKGMTLTFSGPDPVVGAGTVSATPGGTVVVPITLDTAAGLESVEITLLYPADSLELVDVRLGGLTSDFEYFVKDVSIPGRISIDMARMNAMAGGAGTLVELVFKVRAGAQGSLAINLQSTTLNETWLTLNAESQPGLDPTDGRVILPPPLPVSPPVPVAVAPAPAAPAVPAASAAPAAPAAIVARALTSFVVPIAQPPVATSGVDLGLVTVLPTGNNGGREPPSFSVPSATVEALRPAINFKQAAPDFALGQQKENTWVNDWLNSDRDKAAGSKLNAWKVSLPSAKPVARL